MMQENWKQFTSDEVVALRAFRDKWPRKRCHKYYPTCNNWKDILCIAWSDDWSECQGTLRALRNSPRFDGMSDILKCFERYERRNNFIDDSAVASSQVQS